MLKVNWIGGVQGILVIESKEIVEIRDPWDLLTFIEKNKSEFASNKLRVLGGLTLFMSIREKQTIRGPHIISSAKKGIDSFGMIDKAFSEGIETLASKLQPVRSEDGYKLMISAFDYIEQDLETLGWSETAA